MLCFVNSFVNNVPPIKVFYFNLSFHLDNSPCSDDTAKTALPVKTPCQHQTELGLPLCAHVATYSHG